MTGVATREGLNRENIKWGTKHTAHAAKKVGFQNKNQAIELKNYLFVHI